MSKVIKKLFGDSDDVSKSSVDETAAAERRANKGRAALYETEGGVTGQELGGEQVKKRNTLLGN